MNLPKPPEAVTFDCWGTLINDLDGQRAMEIRAQALQTAAAKRGLNLELGKAAELVYAAWRRHLATWRKGEPYGSLGAAEWIAAQLPFPGDEDLLGELTEGLQTAVRQVGTRQVEGAADTLTLLRALGIPTALICDTGMTPGRIIREFLASHGIELDHYLFSDEVGKPKPSSRIFQAALAATGAAAAHAIHIGDLRRTDIAGARGAGMATIRFIGVHDDGYGNEDTTGDEADAVLESWADLPALIGVE